MSQQEIPIPDNRPDIAVMSCDCRVKEPVTVLGYSGVDPRWYVGTCGRCKKIVTRRRYEHNRAEGKTESCTDLGKAPKALPEAHDESTTWEDAR